MKFLKIIFFNLLILLSFVLCIELFFGYWFQKDNFGAYMREHRMKNQRTEWINGDEKVIYFYRRNYHGFRAEDIQPSKIDAIILGGSVIDERYKPEQYTITAYLNKKLKKDFKINLINAGVEGQSTRGMIQGFKNWLFKLENFNPKFILFYVGLNDLPFKEKDDPADLKLDGHLLNPDKKDVFIDNVRSRSILYDSARIFKFKYLPRKGFVKYDATDNSAHYIKSYNFISYDEAVKNYDIDQLKKKYKKKIKNYLYRIDKLYELSKTLNSIPIFITNIASYGHREKLFILNYELMNRCKLKNYNCIDMAKNISGKIEYWRDGTHTTKEGSETFANEIYVDLKKILSKSN